MSNDGNDTLMRMVISGTDAVAAECQTEVSTDDDAYVWDYYNGQFFEVDSFRFNLKVTDKFDQGGDKTGGTSTNSSAGSTSAGTGARQGGLTTRTAPLNAKEKADVPGIVFPKWKSAKPDDITKMMLKTPYPIEMGEISIERTYDKASPVLFDYCCNSKTFESCSLIKRKDIGDKFLRGFLRIDFFEVLVTSVEWKNGEVMKETFNFVFRRLKVQYRASFYKTGSTVASWIAQDPVNWNYATELQNPNPPPQ